MTIIDLFIKKANGEETPKKFKYDGYTFIEDDYGMYKDDDGDDLMSSICCDFSNLNEEIEIIEDKEYEDIEELGMSCSDDLRDEIMRNRYIINALIRNQKYILERLDK